MCLAIPGRIQRIVGESLERTGEIDFGGVVKEISLAFTPEAKTGDYILAHAGVALTVIDEEEAVKTLTLINALGEDPTP